LNRGIKVITHEVGMQPFTGFFTPGEATAYPIKIDENFVLTSEMDQRLDAYLSQRFQGNFSMAGIRFWPQMKGLDQDFLEKSCTFQTNCAGVYQRHFRYQSGSRQHPLPGYVYLVIRDSGVHRA